MATKKKKKAFIPNKPAARPNASVVKKAKVAPAPKPARVVKHASPHPHKSFRLSPRKKVPSKPLPSAFTILKQSLGLLKTHWKLFLGILVIYAALNLVLVRGFGSSLSVSDYRASLSDGGAHPGNFKVASDVLGYVVSATRDSTTESANVYQTLLVITGSLAIIWALRQVLAGGKIRARDAFYKGLFPLAPFILVLLVVGLELIPLGIAGWLYTALVNNGVAITMLERFVTGAFSFLLVLLSLYMLCSSLFALYIVSLPDVTPIMALRSARQLVLHRRWTVIRKLLFCALVIIITAGLVLLPFLIALAPLVEWVYFLLLMSLPFFIHAYLYTLYRELL